MILLLSYTISLVMSSWFLIGFDMSAYYKHMLKVFECLKVKRQHRHRFNKQYNANAQFSVLFGDN